MRPRAIFGADPRGAPRPMPNYRPDIVQTQAVAPSIAYAAASIAALQALGSTVLTDGAVYLAQDTGALWRYSAASTLTTDTSGPFLCATATGAGVGALIRVDREVLITLPETFATADVAVLYTVPTGFVLQPGVAYHRVTTSWTGGTSSAIGFKSSGGGATGNGAMLGGSSGNVAAGLLSTGTYAKGTVGSSVGLPPYILIGGDTFIFQQIASTFTAGAGTANFPVKVLVAPA